MGGVIEVRSGWVLAVEQAVVVDCLVRRVLRHLIGHAVLVLGLAAVLAPWPAAVVAVGR